ncbi:cryptochrome/photolyase family protein [Gemmobacter sp.]|uniref:cryptochrome/photolyase family protein n=1 Tax=Gemmobacter sp. TaxID=1898957 RepID=UPI002AFF1974|nr:cryptochrome/photolyase family protein [Gemmobacter sp.]
MRRLILILGDQLSSGLSSLANLDPARDVVLMAELAEETGRPPRLAMAWRNLDRIAPAELARITAQAQAFQANPDGLKPPPHPRDLFG